MDSLALAVTTAEEVEIIEQVFMGIFDDSLSLYEKLGCGEIIQVVLKPD